MGPTLADLTQRAAKGQGRIVSPNQLTHEQLAEARAQGRLAIYTDPKAGACAAALILDETGGRIVDANIQRDFPNLAAANEWVREVLANGLIVDGVTLRMNYYGFDVARDGSINVAASADDNPMEAEAAAAPEPEAEPETTPEPEGAGEEE